MNPKVEYTDAFFNWLIDKIIKHIYTEIDDRKLIKIDNYINANYKSIFKKTFRSKEILYMFFNNLKVNRYWDKVVIESDPNRLIPGTTVKVVSIVKLITFGSFQYVFSSDPDTFSAKQHPKFYLQQFQNSDF